jgi:ABC-type lipoprotein export system ATPase subunit
MGLLCELHRQGMTVIVVTHDPSVARYARRVITFRDGSIATDLERPPSGQWQELAEPESLSS